MAQTNTVPGVIHRGADQDDARDAAGRDPLERALDGARGRHQPHQRPEYLARARLKPHLVDSFKVSNDPAFAEKVEDVVGLYLDPPDKAVVFSVDEKSQIQALDRSQPGLPMKKGRVGTMTHDYKRHGTTTLFAALNLLDGKVIGHCMKRHRHQEFIRFLNRIDRQTLPYLDIHLIIDNYATHKTPAVKRWLKKHPRFHIHFTPTSASWLNMVERFFAEITRKRIRRGVFKSVAELEQAIYDYLAIHNHNPVPFVWTATATAILEKPPAPSKHSKPSGREPSVRVGTLGWLESLQQGAKGGSQWPRRTPSPG